MKTFNFKFVEKEKLWLLLSLSIIIIGASLMVSKSFNSTPALNYGIDFVGGNTFIPDDPSLYQPRIISELNIGDLSQIKYEGTKRFFYETVTSGFSQVAFSILAVFLLQYFYLA